MRLPTSVAVLEEAGLHAWDEVVVDALGNGDVAERLARYGERDLLGEGGRAHAGRRW